MSIWNTIDKVLTKIADDWELSYGEKQFFISFYSVQDLFICVYKIRKNLSGLFKDLKVENKWLREKQELLGNKTPLYLILKSKEGLFLVREYVEAACNR